VESDSMRQLGTSYKLSTGQVTECAYDRCGMSLEFIPIQSYNISHIMNPLPISNIS
jgi:hypothetical protein